MATKTRQLSDFLVSGGLSDQTEDTEIRPHIKPGMLYPAFDGKLIDGITNTVANTNGPNGSTVVSSKYGTVQSDGRMYYYTNIKGSEPINDPRIGTHYGSSRHLMRALKKDEKMTAKNGHAVHKVDGREWFRTVGSHYVYTSMEGTNIYSNAANVHPAGNWIEVTGYFTDFVASCPNYVHGTVAQGIKVILDGVDQFSGAEQQPWATTNNHVIGGKGWDKGIPAKVLTDLPLGIHTIRINDWGTDELIQYYAIELICQDKTSAATKVQVQIPAQEVISYGKKHEVAAATTHYDPFNGFTNGTTLFSAKVDTATSLGLQTESTYGAPWAISSTNHIRPFNGGRVVKWIDRDGTIKTSVNMVPRNAQNKAGTAFDEIATASATNAHVTNFSDDAINGNLSEITKQFQIREFGNGGSNGGAGGGNADFSQLNTNDDVGYTMDDGLTCANSKDAQMYDSGVYPLNHNYDTNFTFIGTGISVEVYDSAASGSGTNNHYWKIDNKVVWHKNDTGVTDYQWMTLAENLPYGTHVVSYYHSHADAYGHHLRQIAIHQPKMPNVPKDACIIGDYMLMADPVLQTAGSTRYISKGCRLVMNSRDCKMDGAANFEFQQDAQNEMLGGYQCNRSYSDNTQKFSLTAFASNASARIYAATTRSRVMKRDSTTLTSAASGGSQTLYGTGYDGIAHGTAASTPGVHEFMQHGAKDSGTSGSDTNAPHYFGWEVFTPTHTSSHYQTWEDRHLNTLIGGDRNMEQRNLVCSGDGKTWDQLTRDTSYIGLKAGFLIRNSNDMEGNMIWNAYRSAYQNNICFNKGFAIGYVTMWCLEEGWYEIISQGIENVSAGQNIQVNGVSIISGHYCASSWDQCHISAITYLNRNDNIKMYGRHSENKHYTSFYAVKLPHYEGEKGNVYFT